MRAGDLHIQVGIADLLTDLLAHTQGAEHSIGNHERDLAAGSQAGCQTGSVLLRDAHVHMLLRIGLSKSGGFARLSDVYVYYIDVLIVLSELNQLVPQAIAGSDQLFIHLRYPPQAHA